MSALLYLLIAKRKDVPMLKERLLTSDDWISFAVDDYYELTRLALNNCLQSKDIQTIFASENEYETVDIFYVQGGEEKMIDFDFLQLAGKIDGKQYLEELEEIYFGRPDIDCEEIVRRFRLKADTFCR